MFVYAHSATTRNSFCAARSSITMRESANAVDGSMTRPLSVTSRTDGATRSINVLAPGVAENRTSEVDKKVVGPVVRSRLTSYDDVLTIGINRAVTVIAEGAQKGGKGRTAASPLRIIGKHPKTGDDVALYSGRYGPYVKHGKINASLTKGMSADKISMDEALDLIKKREEKDK